MATRFAAILLPLVVMATPAFACRTSDQLRPYLFRDAPAAATGPFIAEVEVTEALRPRPRQFSRVSARVIRVVQGERRVQYIRIDDPNITTCSIFPRVGDRGFLVGEIDSVEGDTAVVTNRVDAPSQLERERSGHAGRPPIVAAHIR